MSYTSYGFQAVSQAPINIPLSAAHYLNGFILGSSINPITVHLDRGYDSARTRELLAAQGLRAAIAQRGTPAPIQAGRRWVVERTNAWTNAHKKLVWCTERRARVIAFWIAL